VFGRPDFTFRRVKLALFVDGCFWHGCSEHGRSPVANASYWMPKLLRNQERDREVSRELRKRGWTVLRIWEHELADLERTRRRVVNSLRRAAAKTSRLQGR
jgi:DNA mismatch endonuclease, patch repair protein